MQLHRNTTFYLIIVDVSATAAAFFGTTVHLVSLRRTVRFHRCVEVDVMYFVTN